MAESYGELSASLLYCGKRRQAMPVRPRFLLVLPDSEMYD